MTLFPCFSLPQFVIESLDGFVIDIGRNDTSSLRNSPHNISVEQFNLCISPFTLLLSTFCLHFTIVHAKASEIDLWATVNDRFLTNMLKQMEDVNSAWLEKRQECDSNCTNDLFVFNHKPFVCCSHTVKAPSSIHLRQDLSVVLLSLCSVLPVW